MKRRYKEGDWIRVKLDGRTDALGLIARACRSRLFGYFFAIPASETTTHWDLKRLREQDAAACALFDGAALEESRWKIIATSVPFDRRAWPFPQFVSRGAFGRVWTRRIYDPETLQIIETHTIDENAAQDDPDARFAGAEELEDLLRERICGVPAHAPFAVYELRPGFDPQSLHVLTRGGRVQFSDVLAPAELSAIAQFIDVHPDVELRVHGFSARGFDVASLRVFENLRALTLDARLLDNIDALASLTHLQRLRVGPQARATPLTVLSRLPSLRELELHGKNADVAAVEKCTQLERLSMSDTAALDVASLASAPVLRELAVAHAASPPKGIDALRRLARLELRDMQLSVLPDLSKNAELESMSLRNVRALRNLGPIASAQSLRELTISGSPQLHVDDFKPLTACHSLHSVHIDVGSRTKSREVYRLLHLGKKQ